MARTTAADVVVDGLRRAGTPRIFAADSTAWEGPARDHGLATVAAGSPEAAVVMAAVTGELADAPGAVILGDADVGPALPGLGYATASRAPVIVLTSEAGAAALASLVKAVVPLEAASAAHWITHACQLALTDPRGPVALIETAPALAEPAVPVATALRPVLPPPDLGALDEAARLLAGAARPVLIAGLESASDEVARWLRPLAEALPAPVLVTRKARGVLPDPHPLAFGELGRSPAAGRLLADADLVVTIGLDVVEVGGAWGPTAPVLHVGRSSPAATRGIAVAVTGNIALTIEELAPRLRGKVRADWDVAALDRLKRSTRIAPVTGPGRLAAIARDLAPAGTLAAVDPGPEGDAVAAAWQAVAPHELLRPVGPAAAGFALAAAIAGNLHHADRRVICFTTTEPAALAELETVARLAIPLVIVVFGDERAPSVAPHSIAVVAAGDEDQFRTALERALRGFSPAVIGVPGDRRV